MVIFNSYVKLPEARRRKILAIDEPGPFFMVSILAILDPILITKNIVHQEH